MSKVIEWAPFKLAPNASEEALLRAADALQTHFLAKQEGYVRRELLRKGEESWCDLIYWENAAAAERAMQHAMESEACLDYFKLMVGVDQEDPGAGLQHLTLVKSY
jgi:hypothetical protein